MPGILPRALLVAVLLLIPGGIAGQDEGRWRFGVAIGGAGLVGVTAEYREGEWGVEGGIATWSFRDLSMTAQARYYHGDGLVAPFIGIGGWGLIAFPGEDTRSGAAFILRVPAGLEMRVADDHAVALELGFSRALLLRRPEEDGRTLPPAGRIVPLPGLNYRYGQAR